MDDALCWQCSPACAVAEGALPEREPHVRVFEGLLHLIARLGHGPVMLADLVALGGILLADLGYGLYLTRCAVTATRWLAFVSPKTGRAVTAAAPGVDIALAASAGVRGEWRRS